MAADSSPVQLWVYDLSQGVARTLSATLGGGMRIDAIWHTSVVVFGTEFCFGAGIETCPPGAVPHGTLVDRIDMGRTHIPQSVFLEYIEDMRSVWTQDKYHLLDNNCNSFSNELCEFLVGKPIPSHITALPAEFINTPLGQSILPLIEGMFGPSRLRQAPPAQPSVPPTDTSSPASHVRPCSSKPELDALLGSHRCIVIDFTSQHCPPCRMISPEFDRLISNANKSYKPLGVTDLPETPVLGLAIDIDRSRDLAAHFGITAMPTFFFFLDGKKFHQFTGANISELKTQIDLLLFTAYPPHAHAKLDLKTLAELCNGTPAHFTQSSNLDAITKKLQTFFNENQVAWDDHAAASISQWLKSPTNQPNSLSFSTVPGRYKLLTTAMLQLPPNCTFPALDLARLVVLRDPSATSFFFVNDASRALPTLMHKVASTSNASDPATNASASIAKPTRMMLLRLLCNMFNLQSRSTPISYLTDASSPSAGPSDLIAIVVDHLLAPDVSLRQSSALLVYNIAWSVSFLVHDHADLKSNRTQSASNTSDSGAMDLIAAICNAIEVDVSTHDDIMKTTDAQTYMETIFRLVSALGLLLAFSTPDVIELAQVVGVDLHLEGVVGKGKQIDVRDGASKRDVLVKVAKEVQSILKQAV